MQSLYIERIDLCCAHINISIHIYIDAGIAICNYNYIDIHMIYTYVCFRVCVYEILKTVD